MFTEISLRSGLDSVETVAEVHLVEIQLEDLILRVRTLDPLGENQFLQLSAERFIRRQKALARELLSDRAAALRRAAMPDVCERGRPDAHEVESVVIVEALVFDRDECPDQMW